MFLVSKRREPSRDKVGRGNMNHKKGILSASVFIGITYMCLAHPMVIILMIMACLAVLLVTAAYYIGANL
jgi:hypothetical protein